MIAADTSTWIGFLEGDGGEDIEMLAKALGDRQVVIVPPVLTELLSDRTAAANGLCKTRLDGNLRGVRRRRSGGSED
jgi:hypothetical protein